MRLYPTAGVCPPPYPFASAGSGLTDSFPPRGTLDLSTLVGDLVAILLVAGEGAERQAVQRAMEVTPAQLARVLELVREAALPGIMVQEHDDLLRLVTRPESSAAVRRFVQAPHAIRLSGAALETLAVIAYGQPT